MANTTPIVTTVTKTANKEKTPKEDRSHSRGRSRRWGSSSRDRPRDRNCPCGIEESYSNTRSSYREGDKHGYHARDKDHSLAWKKEEKTNSRYLAYRRVAPAMAWIEDTGKQRQKGASQQMKKTCSYLGLVRMSIHPEDHLKIFQAATLVEHWAMPTWCHMFNSTLIGAARVWFDELPLESIDGYKGLKAAFLAYFMQQKKYVKNPVEIHNIKQQDGETIEEFIERFKIETGRIKGAPECMQIYGFMHGVNNPELTKRLNEHVPKIVEEMMTATTTFIRGETDAASKKKVHTSWKSQDQSKRQTFERRSDFRIQPKDWRGSNKFTPLTRTPKEIFAAESGKFKSPPPMVTSVEKRSSNKFCEFHNDKGYNTDECVQLRKQIEELLRAGKLLHFIKEIRQDIDQQKTRKKDAPVKDKAATIYMIRPWQRVTRQKVTQSFAHVKEITFPPLTANKGT
nr:reverse transcriptase domain-containing protein [Tanacetum cinerariifolium]